MSRRLPNDSFLGINEDFFEAGDERMVEGGEDADLVDEHEDDVDVGGLEVEQLEDEVLLRLYVLHLVGVDLVRHPQEVQHLVRAVQDVAVVRDVHWV